MILVEKPSAGRLKELKVTSWPIWEKEVSTFEWQYDEAEVCFFLAGEVTVRTKEGEVKFGRGDLVTFPKGLDCTWIVRSPVKKHYRFG